MSDRPEPPPVETDDRFPSGRWTGFFTYRGNVAKHRMDLVLTFRSGMIRGEGRDKVGEFLIVGRYSTTDGKCHWAKRYRGAHDAAYRGFNEGKGIWGTWEIPPITRGGFHIWPEAWGDPSTDRLAVARDRPHEREVEPEPEPIAVGAGVGAESESESWTSGD